MARPQTSPILGQLQRAKTFPEQRSALQALKNEIVGHIQRKEAWVTLGVLEPIVATLASASPPAKQNGQDHRSSVLLRPLSEEDSVKLQALQLIASFANGGPSFLLPLHAAKALHAVLANLSPFANAPQIVGAALRALTDIADAADLASPLSPITLETLADSVFAPQHLESLNAMLSTTSTKLHLQHQVALTAGLIRRLCREERHQQALTNAGILDSLATRLASFAVAGGFVIPGADALAQTDGLSEAFPEPAPMCAKMGPVLDAISAILGDSKYRAQRLTNSPSILAIFPPVKFEAPRTFADPREHLEAVGLSTVTRQGLTAMEFILPAIPVAGSRASSTPHSPLPTPERQNSRASSRTPLNKSRSATTFDTSGLPGSARSSSDDQENIESPLIPWLIHMTRIRPESERPMAAAVLAALVKAGLGSKSLRETSLGMLVIPILVGMLEGNEEKESMSSGVGDASRFSALERIPGILARLIADSEYLSRCAHDCGAITELCKLLKYAYSPVPPRNKAYWSPEPDTAMDLESQSPACELGDTGIDPELAHRIRLREAVLKAIGALAATREDFRKSFISLDIIAYVVESLSELPSKPRQSKERSKEKPNEEQVRETVSPEYGANPLSVIIAACHAIRIFTRSPSILRTTLVDYGVALPVFRLMKHADINVQIAATSAISNLVLEVSPVREPLIEQGVTRVLCEQAHSDNPALRLNALWALKHLVNAIGPDLKKECLEQLAPGWLVQLICDDTQDTALHIARVKEAAEKDLDDDVDMQPSEEPFRWIYWSNGCLRELDASQSARLRQAEDRLAAVREAELNPVRKARNDDIAIQEQGLDFIRNLIGPSASADSPGDATEMIDHLFSELGQDRLFEILGSKLRAKVLNPFSRRPAVAGRETRVLHPQSRVIMAVIYILVHIAASIPRHRQLVIAHTELLKLLLQQSSSKDKEVRVALCHLITNLTVRDDDTDLQACMQRAHELRKLGFQAKMETLRQQDRDLDVKERARAAAWQIEQALY